MPATVPAVRLADLLGDHPAPATVAYRDTPQGTLVLHRFDPPGFASTDRRPAVVWIHGGAWVAGGPAMFHPHCRYFASRGAVAFSMQYRLASPTGTGLAECLDDARAAIRFLRAHAGDLGIDPARVAVLGDSAGGHLAAALATLGDDADPASRPNAAVAFNPITDLTDPAWLKYAVGGDALLKSPPPAATRPTAERLAAARALSPLFVTRKSIPPVLVLHGRADRVVLPAQSERFAAALAAGGADVRLTLLDDARHAFVVTRYTAPDALVVRAIRLADAWLAEKAVLQGPPTLSAE